LALELLSGAYERTAEPVGISSGTIGSLISDIDRQADHQKTSHFKT